MLVFVYGTLKRNFHNFHVMEQAGGEFVGEAVTILAYDLISLGGFPGMVEGEFQIKGEVFDVKDIEPIDWLEGAPDLYRREEIDLIQLEDKHWEHTFEPVFGYLYNGSGGKTIAAETDGVKQWR